MAQSKTRILATRAKMREMAAHVEVVFQKVAVETLGDHKKGTVGVERKSNDRMGFVAFYSNDLLCSNTDVYFDEDIAVVNEGDLFRLFLESDEILDI